MICELSFGWNSSIKKTKVCREKDNIGFENTGMLPYFLKTFLKLEIYL